MNVSQRKLTEVDKRYESTVKTKCFLRMVLRNRMKRQRLTSLVSSEITNTNLFNLINSAGTFFSCYSSDGLDWLLS